ncbi:Uncharacterised protein [Yersinia frederiksenii]|jgi:hypothetical protein|uniref:Uncharacterized protein n=1 Tax=Yersinia frederiksenii TaxID=29484 RepID=A0AAI8ZV78_YERFR|nr:Uncharacterised protein [Yersinia frederiksenii]CQR23394.1 Uncharacterised protein [Yersinia enterocolitica]CFR31923.1 Uncharacterised protein [Yersinia frederiksenii]CNG88285.1 Uncharacterised protein [Yersinia frederiksenii]CNK99421.1 Uncharacterised protein [Yersinia frederiksenii]
METHDKQAKEFAQSHHSSDKVKHRLEKYATG